MIVKYFAAPALDGKTLVLTDPMLATGKTLENVLLAARARPFESSHPRRLMSLLQFALENNV